MSINILRANLNQDYEKSFRNALNNANIEYSNVLLFSTDEDKKDYIISIVDSISDAMPWNTLANVIINWVNSGKEREVIFTHADNKIFYAKGYSASDVSKMLSSCVNITIISDKGKIE